MKVVFAFFVNTLLNFAIGLLVAKFLGPDQFGRFALAIAIGIVIQTAAFDWIRLTAVRFYSERSRNARPELRATLDTTFAIFACGLVALAFVAVFAGMTFSLPQSLVGLAVATAITNGFFDYNTALVRARFNDTLYMRLIIAKNIMALVLTVGGAVFSDRRRWRSPALVRAWLVLSSSLARPCAIRPRSGISPDGRLHSTICATACRSSPPISST